MDSGASALRAMPPGLLDLEATQAYAKLVTRALGKGRKDVEGALRGKRWVANVAARSPCPGTWDLIHSSHADG
jgi:hypothetical protein